MGLDSPPGPCINTLARIDGDLAPMLQFGMAWFHRTALGQIGGGQSQAPPEA